MSPLDFALSRVSVDPNVDPEFREAVTRPYFFDTAIYAKLAAESDAVFYGSCPSPRTPAWREALSQIDAKIEDARWHFDNPGKLGRFRIAMNGAEVRSYGTPRFETEAEARQYLAATPGCDFPGLSVIEVLSREAIAMGQDAARWETPAGEIIGAQIAIGRAA